MDFHKKGNSKFFNNQLLFKTVGIAFLVIVLILILADFRIYQKKKELRAQIVTYQKRIEDIKNSSKTLKDEIANSDNKDYLEKLGYEQFGQTRPGETEYMFITPQKNSTAVQKIDSSWGVNLWLGRLPSVWQWIKSRF
ncbi:MAG: septum formation initiator family protein [Candidatus Staskawiczbacteria bacterium]|nr:septum formation initiator family protein [Candidatus Staskawiczbacteria bacterium]